MEKRHDRVCGEQEIRVGKQEELLLRQQQEQQQPQLPGPASPNPWPPPLSAENENRQGLVGESCPTIRWQYRLDGRCGDGDERNN